MRRILVIILLLSFCAAPAFAVRWPIGAATGSRLDIGAAQAGENGDAIRNGWWWRRRHGQHHEPFQRQLLDIPSISERAAA